MEAVSRELPARNPGMALAHERHREDNEMMQSTTGWRVKAFRRGRSEHRGKPVAKVYQADELALRVFKLAMCGIGLQIALFALLTLWEW